MWSLFLQLWGGIFYLLNKIFFSRVERTTGEKERNWRIGAWVVYLTGLPAWLVIFFWNSNWIAFSVEFGGSLSMVLGLVNAIRGRENEPKWLDYLAWVAVLIGFAVSLYDFGGITVVNQWLELGLATGFLFGTYLVAKEQNSGYLFFVLMLCSNAGLMWIQDYPWLMLQQVISIGFIADAYVVNRKRQRITNFENPSGYWTYEGGYSVELTDSADKSITPAEAKIDGNTVYVEKGSVSQVMGGIQLRANGEEFFWGYKFLKAIKDDSGDLLWVNDNYREDIAV